MYHPNIVQLREVFTTKAFGDSCKFVLKIVYLFMKYVYINIKIHVIIVSVHDLFPCSVM